MKRILLSSLSILVLSGAVAPIAEAQSKQTSLFNIVHLARKGFFQEQNIPSHSAFCSAVASKRVRAKDVVKAAIANDRLSPESLDDKAYLKRVESKMRRACIRN
ncbi:MAG: hypothetical protein MUD14_02625 [Hydrococcus sp. Prado102]|jgi:hypothetical protein|nr:hypothetical protein [Hydrococcus sp. Prado102]